MKLGQQYKIETSPSKKHSISSSIMEGDVWKILKFFNTREVEKRLQTWPFIHTLKAKLRSCLNIHNKKLQHTSIILPIEKKQTVEGFRSNI